MLHHAVCGPHLTAVCERYGLMPEADRIWNALVYNDSLAFAVARLLLWTDPAALPAVGDADAALAYYARNWRPQWWERGMPEPGRWAGSYAEAMDAVAASAA